MERVSPYIKSIDKYTNIVIVYALCQDEKEEENLGGIGEKRNIKGRSLPAANTQIINTDCHRFD